MIRQSLAPTIRAASTNSFSRSESTCERTILAGIEPAEDGEHEDQRHDALAEDPERHVVEPVPDRRGQRDDEQQRRERHRDLDDPRDHRVDPAAEVAGDVPSVHADVITPIVESTATSSETRAP